MSKEPKTVAYYLTYEQNGRTHKTGWLTEDEARRQFKALSSDPTIRNPVLRKKEA